MTAPSGGEPIGREFSAVAFGIASADHPINDEIFDALHAAGEKHGLDISAGSVPYFEHGNELDRKLAEVNAERDRLRSEIAYRDLSWRQWQARIAESGHEHAVGDSPHPGDTAAVWCDTPGCELPDGSNPEWPCPGLLEDLGLDEAAFYRVETVQADKQGADMLGVFVDRSHAAETQRDRLRAALEACRLATPERITGTVAEIVREALEGDHA